MNDDGWAAAQEIGLPVVVKPQGGKSQAHILKALVDAGIPIFKLQEAAAMYMPEVTQKTVDALQALEPDRADALRAELLEVARRFDVSEDDTLVLRLDYLEAVVRKPSWL